MEFTEAIVLKSLDYKDSSKILYLYTNNGLKSIIAHGVKKMNNINRFLSQNGNLIFVTFSKGSFPSLKEGELLNDFPKIKKDLLAYAYVNHLLELVNNTISEDADHPKMFDFLKRILGLFNEGKDPESLSFIFELKLLYFLGYGLNFKECNICGKTDDLVFNIDNGGLVCKSHLSLNQQAYSSEIFLLIAKLYYLDINEYIEIELTKNERVIIRNIIDQLYDQYVSFKTKSRNIIRQIQKY